jgi:hypothetical protein
MSVKMIRVACWTEPLDVDTVFPSCTIALCDAMGLLTAAASVGLRGLYSQSLYLAI